MTRPIALVSAISAALIALLLTACNRQGADHTADAAAPPAPEVGVIALRSQGVPLTVSVPGRVVASVVAEIRPQVDGIIQQRVFVEGSTVKAGDLLYQIDRQTYEAALESAKAALSRAEATVPSAEALVARYQTLVNARGVSKQALDEARASLAQAKADVAAARAEVQSAEINLNYTRVTAPIAGVIGTSTVTQGALVTANQSAALATIRQIDPIYVDLTESSTRMLRIRGMIADGRVQRNGGPPTVDLDLEDGTTYEHSGVISSAESAVSESTDTVSIRAVFPNPDHKLLPGMYARARVEVGIDRNAFLVPQRAVSRNPKGQATAMFVTADNQVETRLLDADRSWGSDWVVHDNVADGDRLVIDGIQKVGPGQTVRAIAVELDDNGVVRQAKADPGTAPATPATAKD